jgi:hypothetical protein
MKRLNTLAPNGRSNDWNEGSARTASPKCPSKNEFFDSIDPFLPSATKFAVMQNAASFNDVIGYGP